MKSVTSGFFVFGPLESRSKRSIFLQRFPLGVLGYFIVAIFVLGIVGGIALRFYFFVREIFDFFFEDYYNRHLLVRRLPPEARKFLQISFKYYRSLSARDQLIFEKRVRKFLDMKEFIPKGDLREITMEMRTLIGAAAVQITFGLPSVYFERFSKILVYPDSYVSPVTDMKHKGEVHTGGFIVLSWRNMVIGYLEENDGRNLGLHEMAHALRIVDATNSEGYDLLDRRAMGHFHYYGRLEMQNIIDGVDSLFRPYAATNDHEFFAVCVENFFERPESFKEYHPELYQSMTDILRQDPMLLTASGSRVVVS